MKNPLVSVIIPVYNCEKTVSIALDSIINQTYKNLEIIVVNDSSTDSTKKIVEEIAKKDNRIKIIDSESDPNRFDTELNRNVNAGYSARNTGFKQAKGELITFQDADDASFLNRIEVQLDLLQKNNSSHLTLDWIQFDEKLLNKELLLEPFLENLKILYPCDLYSMSQRSKGLIAKISITLNKLIPFHLKRKRVIHRIFFGSYENYPGAGNSPLFKREIIEKVQFRNLKNRVWPSFMGRGADKDFNFQVAETFKNSHICFIPLYMWRVKDQNERYSNDIDNFLV